MALDRRNFIAAASAASVSVVSNMSPAAAAAAGGNPFVLHQVVFWLKHPGSQEDKAALIEGLNSLRAIPQARQLYVGIHAGTERRSAIDATFDVSITVFFSAVADHVAYLDHPLHHAFMEKCSGLWESVIDYDSLTQ